MPEFLDTFGWIALCFGGIWLIQLGLLARILRASTWLALRCELEPEPDSPVFLRERAAAESPRVEELGFEADGPFRVGISAGHPPEHGWWWRHEAAGTIVTLFLEPSWIESGVAGWNCRTFFADGSVVDTTNRVGSIAFPPTPGRSEEVMERAALVPLWARHVERVQAHADSRQTLPVPLNRAEASQRIDELHSRSWQTWQADRGMFVETAPGVLRPTWRWILTKGIPQLLALQRALKARTKAAAAAAKSAAPEKSEPPFPYSEHARVELDLCAFRTYDAAARARRLGGRLRALISVVTLLAFALVMAGRSDAEFGVILTLALLVHELGHLVMMRVFGSRDTSLLFIPLFGGAAVLNDRPAIKPWQEVIILLAGPIPGIVIGLGLAAYAFSAPDAPALVSTTASILLALNIFNLLPVMPLDGGQLLNVAFLGRFPRLGAVFKGLSGILLMVAGWYSGFGVLLGVLGFFVLLRLPLEWRLAGAHRDLRRSAKAEGVLSTDEDFWLRRIFQRLRMVQFQGMAAVKKQGEATRMVQVLRHPPARLGTMFLAVLGWSSPVWLLLAALPAVKWFGERELQRVELAARSAGLPRPDQTAERAAKLRASVPAEQDAGPIYAEIAQKVPTPLNTIWQRASRSAARSLASQPAPNAEAKTGADDEENEDDADSASELANERDALPGYVQLELWKRLEEGAKRTHWLSPAGMDTAERAESKRRSDASWIARVLGEELWLALSGRDAARAGRALAVWQRLLEQDALSRSGVGEAVSVQLLETTLAQLERGLADWGHSPQRPASADAALVATALPARAWLERQVVPSYLDDLPRLEAASFGWRDRLKSDPRRDLELSWFLQIFLRLNEYGPLEPKRHAAMLAQALRVMERAAKGSDPWQAEGPKATGPDEEFDEATTTWVGHRDRWARMVLRLDFARAALAWHLVRASGGEVKRSEDLRAPWLPSVPRHPISGKPLEFDSTHARGPRLVLPSSPGLVRKLEKSLAPALLEEFRKTSEEAWYLTPAPVRARSR